MAEPARAGESRADWLARFSADEPVEIGDLAHQLDGLETRGARGFDAIGCDCARALIGRAAGLEARASALLLRRARVHVARLAERFEAAAVHTAHRLEAVERDYGPQPRARAWLEKTDLGAARRALRRMEAGPSFSDLAVEVRSEPSALLHDARPSTKPAAHTATGREDPTDAACHEYAAGTAIRETSSAVDLGEGPSRADVCAADSDAPRGEPPAHASASFTSTDAPRGEPADHSARLPGSALAGAEGLAGAALDGVSDDAEARASRCAEEYDAAMTELASVMALARAEDGVPEQAGPYNPLRIASDLLERIRAVSPLYLNAQLLWLGELANMLALPELPGAQQPAPPPAPTRPPPRRPSRPPRRRATQKTRS